MKKGIVLLCMMMICCGCSAKNSPINEPNRESEYVIFQDKYSMDWDDDTYLLINAQYHGGRIEDKAYTILVTLNNCFEYSEGIESIVKKELYKDGLTDDDIEAIVPDNATKEALRMIMFDRFDNSLGSLEFLEFYEEDLH